MNPFQRRRMSRGERAARSEHGRHALGGFASASIRTRDVSTLSLLSLLALLSWTGAVGLITASGAHAQPAAQSPASLEANLAADADADMDAGVNDAAASGPAEQAARVTPPRVLHRVDALYPSDAWDEGLEGRVELFVTVDTHGEVAGVEIASSAGAGFDAAAIAAVRQWRFEPARRAGLAVVSRIRVPISFSLPSALASPAGPLAAPSTARAGEVGAEPPARAAQTQASAAAAGADGQLAEADVIDVTVQGQRSPRAVNRSVSDFELDHELLSAAPRSEGAELLRSAPGVYIGRGEGPAVAHNYMLRGFDAEHGQDIAFKVGGLPINLPSHIHGQGYADLGFLIGDSVQKLQVSEGVSDPRQGDFSVAGSIDIQLGVAAADRGARVRTSYGSFNTFRQLAMWAPPAADTESFGAAQYMRTDGYGQNRAAQTGSGVFQLRFGSGELHYRAVGIIHAARSDLAGVLRKDDIDSGRSCFTCSYPYPSARAQNALNDRVLLGLFADYESERGDNGQWGVFVGYDNFRLQENFTGFLQQSRMLARVAGRGDLLEQQNRTLSLGLTGRYRSAPLRPARWTHGTIELGMDGRLDVIDQAQNLLDATVHSQTWDRRVDAGIRSVDLGLWGDLDWRIGEAVRARLGVRGDVLSFDVDDRLGNFAPLIRPRDSYIVGFRRSALGLAAGPRSSLELRVTPWLSVLAAYGEGYRSPQARQLEDGDRTPFSKVHAADLGLRVDLGPALQLSVGGYYTRLSDDVAFAAAEGRLERIGATERVGAVAHLVTRPAGWLVGSLSFTFVRATLLEPPPPTAEEPQPPFASGQSLPFVPPVVVRADLGARRQLLRSVGGQALDGRIGLGFSYLSPRPLPYSDFADPVALLDASAALQWSALTLGLDVFNALGAQYAAVEYSFPSDWNPNDGLRPRTPARHIAAGSPFACMLSLGVTL